MRAIRASSRVPITSATVLGECPAIQFRPGAQADPRGVNLQPNPFPCFRQRAHRQMIFLVSRTERNRILAPKRAMLPVAVIELQHDGFGRVIRIEKDMRE